MQFDTLDDAIEFILLRFPETNSNDLYAMLMAYHNTLLHELDIKE